MKNPCLLALAVSLFFACGRTEKAQEATQSATGTTDSMEVIASKPKNCQSILEANQLGKANTYQESAKPVTVTMTLDQDTSSTQTTSGCYFNNSVAILAVKKSGSRIFKRTLLKDDLLYFIKSDDVVERSVLQNATYKPTFNGQKYITITIRVLEPVSRKSTSYTVFMNYFGEIVKVK